VRIIAVILAGGRGERFWPLSRRSRPKQFLPLVGDRSMLGGTLERLDSLVDPRDRWILTASDLKKEAERLAPGVSPSHIIGEPVGKNTAPAIGLVSWWLQDEGKDVAVAVLPSDHRVEPASRFLKELRQAAQVLKRHPQIEGRGGVSGAGLESAAIAGLGLRDTSGFVKEAPEIETGVVQSGGICHNLEQVQVCAAPRPAVRWVETPGWGFGGRLNLHRGSDG